MRCTECGSEMRFTDEPMKEMYKKEEFTVEGIKRWVCDKCGNDVMAASEADHLGHALASAYAKSKGLLSPSEIRKLREMLGMSQKDFECLLGVSTPTASRWETGAVQQSKPVDNLMRLIRDVPEAREKLLERVETRHEAHEKLSYTASSQFKMRQSETKKWSDPSPERKMLSSSTRHEGYAWTIGGLAA